MIDLEVLKPWLHRETRVLDTVSASLVARLAALLDYSKPPIWGSTIPTNWYLVLFGCTERQSLLATDGHPHKGDLLPPIPWSRRMFAGRRVEFPGDLQVGDEVVRTSCVTAITPKQGRAGPMCFVTLRHELHTCRGMAVIEEQDLVYLPGVQTQAAGLETASTGTVVRQAPLAAFTCSLVPDATLLFRYSALTNNAHRIHYDSAYARDVEGYPDLLVNGGLSTLLLWDFAERSLRARLRCSITRNLKPLFVSRALSINVATLHNGRAAAWVEDESGTMALEAKLELL